MKKHDKKSSKKPAEKSAAERRKYADEYREIHDSLKNIIARNDVEPRHIVMRLARSIDKAGRILAALIMNDCEDPWRSLSKPDPALARDNGCIDAGQFWAYHGIKWLREEKPLCFDMKPPGFDPSCIRADAKGVPLEGNVLAVLREQIEDHLSGCRAMIEILEAEAAKWGGEEKTPAKDGELTGEGKALALLVQHGDWDDTTIAKHVPCARTTLYDWPRYMAAREAQKKNKKRFPQGSKDGKTGDLEAWEDEK